MTDPAPAPADTRPYSPGLEGVIAGETSLSFIDGEAGRLLYRGYPIGELVKHGSYASVAELLWTGEWDPAAKLPCLPVSPAVLTALRALPHDFLKAGHSSRGLADMLKHDAFEIQGADIVGIVFQHIVQQ